MKKKPFMKKKPVAASAAVLALSAGCAFAGLNVVPMPTPLPAAPSPTPGPTSAPASASPTLAPGATPTPTPDPARVQAGKAVYESKCVGCHGTSGTGSGKDLRGMVEPALSQKVAGSSLPTMGDWNTLTADQKADLSIYLGQL